MDNIPINVMFLIDTEFLKKTIIFFKRCLEVFLKKNWILVTSLQIQKMKMNNYLYISIIFLILKQFLPCSKFKILLYSYVYNYYTIAH